MDNKTKVIKAWEEFSKEFNFEKTNEIQKGNLQFYQSESEFLYSLVRMTKPKTIIEISPDEGFTSVIMLQALEKNGIPCKIHSFDIHEKSKRHNRLTGDIQRELFLGDVKQNLTDELIKQADFILIDSDHSYEFGKWYSKRFQIVKPGTFIIVHDWPQYASDGATNNIIAEYAPPAVMQDIWNLEVLAVKQYFISKGHAEPILNVVDFLKENKKPYYETRDGVMYRALSPSQILVKL